MKEGVYVGPAGQLLLIEWDDGPGYGHGHQTYTLDDQTFYAIDCEYAPLKQLLEGWEYLGELGEPEEDDE